MQDGMKTVFRLLLVAYLVLYCASIAATLLVSDPLYESVYDYGWSIHPGIRVTVGFWTGMLVAYAILLLASLIGMFLFWVHARGLLIIALVFGHLIGHIVGLGPVIYPQVAYNLEFLSATCIGAALAMSFVGPVSDLFQSRGDSNAAA